jgi:hypothetical protein
MVPQIPDDGGDGMGLAAWLVRRHIKSSSTA